MFPDTLQGKRQEVWDVFSAVQDHVRSTSTLELIGLDDPNFLLRIRSSVAADRQLVVFLDGNSGQAALKKEKRDVELSFFDAELLVKTTILRLADILGLPVTTFNSVRHDIRRTLFLDPPVESQKGKNYETAAAAIFGRLVSRLSEEPAQWEGWLYFQRYFSDTFRGSLGNPTGQLLLEKKSRYFLGQLDHEEFLFDKQTYKQYRINKREGAAA
ncbi:MAG: hypothetical protein ACJ746_18185 [Bryobacteraceae bacterium]